MLLIGNGKLITRDPALPYLEDGAVVADGPVIQEVGDRAALAAKYPNAQFVDAKGGVIMPGLINAHTHIYSGLARGLSIRGNNPNNFLEVLEGLWWNIDRHLSLPFTRACAQATVLECIRCGVTTIFDHHASFGEIPGSLFEIAKVTGEMGIRANLCYEVSDRDGEEKCLQAIQENADFAKYCREQDSDMLQAMFGGHALFTLSDKTLERMAAANNGMTGYHIHVSEGLNDVYDSMQKYGTRAVNRLLYSGMLGEKTILGHCIHLSPAEMDIVAQTGSAIVNNPQSNMGNAVGCAPVLEFFKRGILVGLGTDAYTHDMLESLKVLLGIQRHNAGHPNVAWGEATSMLFQNNAKIGARYFKKPLGILAAGAAADVIVMDYQPFTPFDHTNVDGHMIFGMTGRHCTTTVINGQVVMENRRLTRIDEEQLNADIMAQARELWGILNP